MEDEKTRQFFEMAEVLPPENQHDFLLPVPRASGEVASYRGVPSMPRVTSRLVYPNQIASVGVTVSDARRINYQWYMDQLVVFDKLEPNRRGDSGVRRVSGGHLL